ncbi:LOW QUALITY PROTEIN: hypothetical protein TorRG33x02_295900 [Trema orientale]|uniref:Uncharacterized protein n=1 Tax=Trema orientale TaxID=63057 RepID=A0A2P5C636_TREOI|nr:LOW QUALITY PROTEIN: hypothetical protein TorRG33x02_295900 [Trema orientale]
MTRNSPACKGRMLLLLLPYQQTVPSHHTIPTSRVSVSLPDGHRASFQSPVSSSSPALTLHCSASSSGYVNEDPSLLCFISGKNP